LATYSLLRCKYPRVSERLGLKDAILGRKSRTCIAKYVFTLARVPVLLLPSSLCFCGFVCHPPSIVLFRIRSNPVSNVSHQGLTQHCTRPVDGKSCSASPRTGLHEPDGHIWRSLWVSVFTAAPQGEAVRLEAPLKKHPFATVLMTHPVPMGNKGVPPFKPHPAHSRHFPTFPKRQDGTFDPPSPHSGKSAEEYLYIVFSLRQSFLYFSIFPRF
jgi:hypothetical protein